MTSSPDTPLQRFLRSMTGDLDRWRDGVGYDLMALSEASPSERSEIEAAVLSHRPRSWHDIEALAAIDTPRTRQAIVESRHDPDPMVQAAVMRFASSLVDEDERVESLVNGLENAKFYGGLTQLLDQVEQYHPPRVCDALMRGALQREGEVAVHFAAMLMFLHGRAAEAFDWDHRPFFLLFHTEDRREREAAFCELCRRIDLDPSPWLTGSPTG